MSDIAVLKKSFHLWSKLTDVVRFQPFKVCKCKLISALVCVVSLSYAHKSELFLMFVCFVYFPCFDILMVNVPV